MEEEGERKRGTMDWREGGRRNSRRNERDTVSQTERDRMKKYYNLEKIIRKRSN